MKSSSISQIAVLCGLALGVMALWAGAAPIGIDGEQIIGGWYGYIAEGGELIGCSNSSDCDPCSGITYVYCSDGPEEKNWRCHGGGFYAAVAGTGATPHGTGSAALCDGPTGNMEGYFYCEVNLQHATCN